MMNRLIFNVGNKGVLAWGITLATKGAFENKAVLRAMHIPATKGASKNKVAPFS